MSPNFAERPRSEAADNCRLERLLFLVPIAVFLALAVAFAWGLTNDPRKIPSPLIGKPVPHFRLSPVKGRRLGLSSANLQGHVSLVNVFASWCVECRLEHPLIMRLKSRGIVTIDGLNYKDHPDDAARFFDMLGDPYTRTGADMDGRVGIDWGVYSVPETFVISKDGRIADKEIGPLSVEILAKKIIPLIETLKQRPLPEVQRQREPDTSNARR